MNPIQAARAAGQQIWLDNLSRALINEGTLARHIADGVAGVTTNPAIFHKAIAEGLDYLTDLDALRARPLDAEARYEALVIQDVQRACASADTVCCLRKGRVTLQGAADAFDHARIAQAYFGH